MSDPLLGSRPKARRPRPRFGFHGVKAPDTFKMGEMVKYTGPATFKLANSALPDHGIVVDGPYTARELGISLSNQDMIMYEVAFNNRTENTRCWHPAQALERM